MANPLMDAITQSVASQFDPTNAMARDYMSAVTKEKMQDVTDRQAQTIENIERKLEAAKDRNAAASVIGAYEKLLAQVIGH